MPRKPEDIKDLDHLQISAYYKSFLKSLDESSERVSDWEADFIGSCLSRVSFTENQKAVIQRLMDKFPKIYPRFDHYKTHNNAEDFLYL